MREESRRQKRVSNLLREALGPILIDEVQAETGGLLTITRVEMPADLLQARVYVSLFGAEPEAVLALLEGRAGQIRRRLAACVDLKYNPQLVFKLDPSASEIERIDRLLDASSKKHGRRR